MKEHSGTSEDAGLQFFGKVTASISHEIKNVLAVINENAGLLEDLVLMAEKGRPLENERIKLLAGKVKDQVCRGDEIIENMNRFAHSVDRVVDCVDLGEVLALVVKLAQRFASMKEVLLETRPTRDRIMITTSPFLLENLIWLCLDFAIDSASDSKIVGLVPEVVENGVRIRVTGLGALFHLKGNAFSRQRWKGLLSALQGDLTVDAESGELVIGIPRDMPRDNHDPQT